jgi:hypothetical protein
MKELPLLNRSILYIQPKQNYLDWINEFELEEDEIKMELEDLEGNSYLIEEDFLELEPIIEQNFKKILTQECMLVTENETDWPTFSIELFFSWFDISVSSMIFDLEKGGLNKE